MPSFAAQFGESGEALFGGEPLLAFTGPLSLHLFKSQEALPVWSNDDQFRPGGDSVEQLALAPDGVTLATWDFNAGRQIVLSDVGTGKRLRVLEVQSSQPQARPTLHGLCFSPDSRARSARQEGSVPSPGPGGH